MSVIFWISGHISATKRATGDPLVSKRPDFRGLFGFSKKITFWISGFLYFLIFGFLDFFWISGYISATKRATGDFLMSKRPDFRGLPTPRIALFVRWFVRWFVTKFAALSCLAHFVLSAIAHFVLSALAHSTNDEYQESAVLFEPLYTRPERPKGAKDKVN